jgi:RNA polymerase primary sigma factor
MDMDLVENCNLVNDEIKEVSIEWDDFSLEDYCKEKCGLYNQCAGNRERCAKNIAAEIFASLTKNEETVLRLRSGFCGGKYFSMNEVAELLGVSREQLRRIEAKAFRKLRHPCRRKILEKLGIDIDSVTSTKDLFDQIIGKKN